MTVPSEPLNVRVAVALGWEWWKSSVTGRRCLYPPERHPEWMTERADGTEPLVSDWNVGSGFVPPYGADTPEGWAVTGPLVAKYELHLEPDLCAEHKSEWLCYRHDDIGGSVNEASGPNPCAAVAEWVAAFGGPDAAR
jgi:hypothetical protein